MVVVINKDKDPGGRGGYRAGTAFHVGGGRFFTNGLIVELTGPNSAWGPDGLWIGADLWGNVPTKVSGFRYRRGEDTFGPATQVCKDSRWKGFEKSNAGEFASPFDFGSFTIPSIDLPSYKLADKDPNVGDQVRGEGYASASIAWPAKLYEWSGTVNKVGDGRMWITITEGFNIPGSSGSPIRNRADDVVGILYGGDYPDSRTPAPHALAVPVSTIESSACR